MTMRTIAEPVTYEQKLISIIRRLPPERVSEVIDFAHFLEFQTTSTYESVPDGDRSQEEILTENARWDALLATDESQHMLEKMADEVLAEIQAGHARPFVFIEDEEIAPV